MSIIKQGFESADLDVPVVLLTLNLDFANSQSLDKRITFTRGSIGTRVNRNGLIETIAANQPRFDFDPISGECRGLLIEESRSNLLLYSQDLGTGWSNTAGTTELVNVTTAPDGTSTADKLVEDISSGQHYISSNSVSWASSTTYTLSVFAKAETRYFLDLAFGTSSFWVNGHRRAVFNLARGTIHSTAGASLTALITPYPNGWYRCSITATTVSTAVAATTCQLLITSDGTSGGSYPGNGTSGIYIWGAQLEAGAFPTSYIPTTASTVTRSADNADMTKTNFSSWYNSSEGTLFVSARINALGGPGYPGIAYVDDGTVNNCMGFYVDDAGTDRIGAELYISGRLQYGFASSSATTANKLNKAISSYSINNFSGAFDTSGQVQRDTNGSIPTVDRLRIGALRGDVYKLNGTISRLTYYPRALSPSQLQYLTQ